MANHAASSRRVRYKGVCPSAFWGFIDLGITNVLCRELAGK